MTTPAALPAVSTADVELATVAPGGASRRMLRHRGFVIAGAILGVIVLMALTAPLVAPYDPYAQDLGNRLVPPAFMEGGSWAHPFGTDALGRAYLSQRVYGSPRTVL